MFAARRRFSLRMLMALVAATALLLVIWSNYRISQSNRSLRAENRRLRDEVGEVSIEDPRQLHAIQVPSRDPGLEWIFRLWIPEGREYRARVVGDQIPKRGYPQDGGTITLGPGEQVLRYRIAKRGDEDKFFGTLSSLSAGVGGNEHEWPRWPSMVSTTEGVGKTTVAFPPGQVVEVCRHRVSQAFSSDRMEDPSAGFLIWMEPSK